jgi:hypothetical protein
MEEIESLIRVRGENGERCILQREEDDKDEKRRGHPVDWSIEHANCTAEEQCLPSQTMTKEL